MIRNCLKSVLLLSVFTMGCMDVSPPLVKASNEDRVHNVVLPFDIGVYAEGDSDSLPVYVRMVSGDSATLPPGEISFRFNPVQAAITIDSLGRLKINSYYAALSVNGVNLIASHTLGGVTRSDTAKLFVTQQKYDVARIKITPLDSAKGGVVTFVTQITGDMSGLPEYKIEAFDSNDDPVTNIDFDRFLSRFVTSYTNGTRLPPVIKVNFSAQKAYMRGNAPVGTYWAGIESYLYGKYVKDSTVFNQLTPAEIMFSFLPTSMTAVTEVLQPCALLAVRNLAPDTILVDLSDIPHDIVCAGQDPALSSYVLPPRFVAVVGALGYKDGTTIEWKATNMRTKSSVASGKFRFRHVVPVGN